MSKNAQKFQSPDSIMDNLILRNRSGNRETREEAIALGRQEVTAVWMGVGAVEEES